MINSATEIDHEECIATTAIDHEECIATTAIYHEECIATTAIDHYYTSSATTTDQIIIVRFSIKHYQLTQQPISIASANDPSVPHSSHPQPHPNQLLYLLDWML